MRDWRPGEELRLVAEKGEKVRLILACFAYERYCLVELILDLGFAIDYCVLRVFVLINASLWLN